MEAIAVDMGRIIPQLWTVYNHKGGRAFPYSGRMQNEATRALADNVRRLMDSRDPVWKLTDLARHSGVSKSALSYLLNYRDSSDRHPTTETVEGIATAFGLPVWQLMMPNLPIELLQSHRMARLIENYRDAPPEGRAQVERIAESEVKYAVAEAVMTGRTG